MLVEVLEKVNRLYEKPAWYNTLWNNCTTTIHIHLAATQDFPMPWNWGILFPDLYCKSICDRGGMESDLPYEELWKRGHVNEHANRIGRPDDFWMQIRKDVPASKTTLKAGHKTVMSIIWKNPNEKRENHCIL